MYIAKTSNINFWIPEKTWYSFFNSPYPAHRNGTAVDVYFEGEALFPFEEGIVREFRKINTRRGIEDSLILVDINNFVLKILHVKPFIKIGDKLYLGDSFGKVISSGFLCPWSDKHAHFELRKPDDPYRARGGLLLMPIIQPLTPIAIGNKFIVVEREKNYVWVKPLNHIGRGLTPLSFHGKPIEGGIPHYHYGAIFGNTNRIDLMGNSIDIKEHLPNGIGLFDAKCFRVEVNGVECIGIGIYCNQPFLKLISKDFEEEDVIEIKISKS